MLAVCLRTFRGWLIAERCPGGPTDRPLWDGTRVLMIPMALGPDEPGDDRSAGGPLRRGGSKGEDPGKRLPL
jgi:hypothetical protein